MFVGLLLLPLVVYIFYPLIHNFCVFAYPLIPLGDDLLEFLALLLIVFEELLMVLSQVLLFFPLVTLPTLPFLLTLLRSVHYYLFEFLSLFLLKLLNLIDPLLDGHCPL